MRKARFTEHQIITVLKSVEAGISQASYFNWKTKYGGIEAADIKKPKDPLRIAEFHRHQAADNQRQPDGKPVYRRY